MMCVHCKCCRVERALKEVKGTAHRSPKLVPHTLAVLTGPEENLQVELGGETMWQGLIQQQRFVVECGLKSILAFNFMFTLSYGCVHSHCCGGRCYARRQTTLQHSDCGCVGGGSGRG